MHASLAAAGNVIRPQSYSPSISPVICRFPTGVRPFSVCPKRYSLPCPLRARRPAFQRAAIKSEAATFTSETNKAANPLRIVFVSAEVGPWSKTGGLGDVVGGLPIALAQRGHNVLTIAPRYFYAC